MEYTYASMTASGILCESTCKEAIRRSYGGITPYTSVAPLRIIEE